MPRLVKKPTDPVTDAITEFRISAKILVAKDKLMIHDPVHEDVVKKALERSASFLTIAVKNKELDIPLSDNVLAITGPITKDNISDAVSKIYQFRNEHVIGRNLK